MVAVKQSSQSPSVTEHKHCTRRKSGAPRRHPDAPCRRRNGRNKIPNISNIAPVPTSSNGSGNSRRSRPSSIYSGSASARSSASSNASRILSLPWSTTSSTSTTTSSTSGRSGRRWKWTPNKKERVIACGDLGKGRLHVKVKNAISGRRHRKRRSN